MLSRLSNVAYMGAKVKPMHLIKPLRCMSAGPESGKRVFPIGFSKYEDYPEEGSGVEWKDPVFDNTMWRDNNKWTVGQRDWADQNEAYEHDIADIQQDPFGNQIQTYKDLAGDSAAKVLPIGLFTVLWGKEYFVLNEEMGQAFLLIPTLYLLYAAVGPSLLDIYDEYKSHMLTRLNQGRQDKIDAINRTFEEHEARKLYHTTLPEICDVQKEMVEMKLEATHREHLKEVELAVAKKMDYHVELQKLLKKIEYEHAAKWVEKAVISSITPKQEAEALQKCISDINLMAQAKIA